MISYVKVVIKNLEGYSRQPAARRLYAAAAPPHPASVPPPGCCRAGPPPPFPSQPNLAAPGHRSRRRLFVAICYTSPCSLPMEEPACLLLRPRTLSQLSPWAHGCRPAASEWPQGRDGGAGAAAKVAASQLWSGEELVDHGGGGSAADRGGTPAVLQIYLDIVRRR